MKWPMEILTRRTASDKILRDKEFNISKNPKYDGYERCPASIVYRFFEKKSSTGGGFEMMSSKKLAEQLHKPITEKFEKRKVHPSFKDNIWVLILQICN